MENKLEELQRDLDNSNQRAVEAEKKTLSAEQRVTELESNLEDSKDKAKRDIENELSEKLKHWLNSKNI